MNTLIRHLLNIALFLLLLQGLANAAQAQVRVGGRTAPHPSAVLDLNAANDATGDKGLLLPRVALKSLDDPFPLVEHSRGMQVFNVADLDDQIYPGIYYNDGRRWTHMETDNSRERYFIIEINEDIDTESVIFHGEFSSTADVMNVMNIKPVFSDPNMVHTFLTVTNLAKTNSTGQTIFWSVRIVNANIDPDIKSTLERVIISYFCTAPIPVKNPLGPMQIDRYGDDDIPYKKVVMVGQ
jgi:hypothetical protein